MKKLKEPKSCVNCIYFGKLKELLGVSFCKKMQSVLWRELGKQYKICENYKEKKI